MSSFPAVATPVSYANTARCHAVCGGYAKPARFIPEGRETSQLYPFASARGRPPLCARGGICSRKSPVFAETFRQRRPHRFLPRLRASGVHLD